MLLKRILGDFRNLCKPAIVYFIISFFIMITVVYQNYGLENVYCMGNFGCYVPNTKFFIFSEVMYILFWTWILHLMCRTGYSSISWFIVIFPILLFFVIIGLLMVSSQSLEKLMPGVAILDQFP